MHVRVCNNNNVIITISYKTLYPVLCSVQSNEQKVRNLFINLCVYMYVWGDCMGDCVWRDYVGDCLRGTVCGGLC